LQILNAGGREAHQEPFRPREGVQQRVAAEPRVVRGAGREFLEGRGRQEAVVSHKQRRAGLRRAPHVAVEVAELRQRDAERADDDDEQPVARAQRGAVVRWGLGARRRRCGGVRGRARGR